MVKQYLIHLMNAAGIIERRFNTTSAMAAIAIAKQIYDGHRIIDITDVAENRRAAF